MNFRYICSFSLLLLTHYSLAQSADYTIISNPNSIIYDVCFSKGGSLLVYPENNIIYIYDVKQSRNIQILEGAHLQAVLSVDLSSDSSLVVSGGKDGLINIWDINSKQVIHSINPYRGVICTVKFSPDNKYIAAGTADGSVILLDPLTGNEVKVFTGFRMDINALSFSNNSPILAFGGGDKKVVLINTSDWNVIDTISKHTGWIRDIDFCEESGNLLACGDNGNLNEWQLYSNNEVKRYFKRYKSFSWLLSADFNYSDSDIATGSLSGLIKVNIGQNVYKYRIQRPVQKVRFIPNCGELIKIAVATRGKGLIIINAENMKLYGQGRYKKPYDWY